MPICIKKHIIVSPPVCMHFYTAATQWKLPITVTHGPASSCSGKRGVLYGVFPLGVELSSCKQVAALFTDHYT